MGSSMGQGQADGGTKGIRSGLNRRVNPRHPPPGPAPCGRPFPSWWCGARSACRQVSAAALRRFAAASSSGPNSTIRPAARAASA